MRLEPLVIFQEVSLISKIGTRKLKEAIAKLRSLSLYFKGEELVSFPQSSELVWIQISKESSASSLHSANSRFLCAKLQTQRPSNQLSAPALGDVVSQEPRWPMIDLRYRFEMSSSEIPISSSFQRFHWIQRTRELTRLLNSTADRRLGDSISSNSTTSTRIPTDMGDISIGHRLTSSECSSNLSISFTYYPS